MLQIERGDGNDDEQERQGGGQPVLGRIVEQRVDARGQRDDARGQAEDRLRAEQGDRVHECQQRARQHRRRDQRQRHEQRGAQPAGAQDLRGLLVGGVHRLQRARCQQEHEREGVQHRDQHQAGHREHVEREPGRAQHVAQEHVDQAGIGAEQVHIGDGRQERRRKIGERGRRPEQGRKWHVGAAHGPGHRQPDEDAEEPGPGPQHQGVGKGLDVEPARERLGEMLKRQPVLAAHAAHQEEQERQHDQHDQRRNRGSHHAGFEPWQKARPRAADLTGPAHRGAPRYASGHGRHGAGTRDRRPPSAWNAPPNRRAAESEAQRARSGKIGLTDRPDRSA